MSLIVPPASPSPAPTRLWLAEVGSPIGDLGLAWDARGRVRGLSFSGQDAVARSMAREYPEAALETGDAPAAAVQALSAYFAGDREGLERVGWSLDGARSETLGAGFHARVWRTLADVPWGVTLSYGEMARRAGASGPEAARATGVALNRNPLPLILACHRVVGADGSMTGFGGGLERKTWLLRHEGALLI